MRFKALLRFRQDEGEVPIEILRELRLPMPEDVLEQFLADHGTKFEFQDQYGALDLHSLTWRLATLPAREILAASMYPDFADYTGGISDRTRVVGRQGWDGVWLPPEYIEHWKQYSTWMRSPVALRGDLVGADRPIHLVEGHTRVGALRGLVEGGALREDSVHGIWIGEPRSEGAVEDPWRDVLRRHHIPFLNWLIDRTLQSGEPGVIGLRLINARHDRTAQRRVEGDDFTAVLEFARGDAVLEPLLQAIHEAHGEWTRFIDAQDLP